MHHRLPPLTLPPPPPPKAQFAALRRLWGLPDGRLLRSLARCARWDAGAGKSGAAFARTRDGGLLLKQLCRPELQAVLDFAPAYCAYAGGAAAEGRPVLLCKLLGVFTLSSPQPGAPPGRRDGRRDCVLLEHLTCGSLCGPVFDLKGAVRRAAAPSAPVLLDDNLAERSAADAPLALAPGACAALGGAVARDSAFLARLGVMDYSLLAALDAPRGRLVVGIVDYLRTYTWDKQLENAVKSGQAALGVGGAPAQPTVVSPHMYARRFRRAMRDFFVAVPDLAPEPTREEEEAAAADNGQP